MGILAFLAEYWPTILSLLGVGGCGILFYKQEAANKDLTNIAAAITNSTAQNEEWRKLLDERTAEVRRLNDKLDRVYKEKSFLRDRLEQSLEKDALAAYYRGLYHSSRCDNWSCINRRPPIKQSSQTEPDLPEIPGPISMEEMPDDEETERLDGPSGRFR